MDKPEPWSDMREVAKHIGVSEDTVRRWMKSKQLPAHQLGRVWRFKISEVDEWIRAGGAKSPSPQEGDEQQ